jgi:hypothetical protein
MHIFKIFFFQSIPYQKVISNLIVNSIQSKFNIVYLSSVSQILCELMLSKIGISKSIIVIIILFL